VPVPGGADAEHGPAAGQDVQSGHLLDEDARVAVGHAGDQSEQLGPARVARDEPERGVGLEHVVLGRPDHPDLEEVVHHRYPVEPGVVGQADQSGQIRSQALRTAAVGKIGEL